MSDRICVACGQSNAADAQYCRGCGELLALPATPQPAVPEPPANTGQTTASSATPPVTARSPAVSPRAKPAGAKRVRPARSPVRYVVGIVVLAVLALGAGWLAWHLIGAPGITLAQVTAQKETAEDQLAQTRALTVEKDSLLSELLETTTLLSDINSAVSAVQNGRNSPVLAEAGDRPLTARQARAILMPKIDSLRQRLAAAESRMGASLERVHQMSPTETQLRQQIAQYERTVASVRKVVAEQQEQLNSLGTELTSLKAENKRLLDVQQQMTATQGVLQDSMTDLKENENTVYWVAGSKSALLELGVIAEEGSGKVLMFGKGKSVTPARTLSASDFTAVNKRQTTVVNLPKPNQRYRILTRQNLAGLSNALDKDGHVRGTLQIADPATFWAASPYLILIED